MPYQQVDAVAKLVPMELRGTLQKALKTAKAGSYTHLDVYKRQACCFIAWALLQRVCVTRREYASQQALNPSAAAKISTAAIVRRISGASFRFFSLRIFCYKLRFSGVVAQKKKHITQRLSLIHI